MANRTTAPRRRLIYGITAGLLAFGFAMMALYDTGEPGLRTPTMMAARR